MALNKQYVAVADNNTLGNKYHTQINCRTLHAETRPELVRIVEDRDGNLYATHRGFKTRVTACEGCPPPLKWKWQDDAACMAAWPAVDMVNIGQGKSPAPLIAEFCDNCPVIAECAEFALSRPEEMVGIWGGVLLRPNKKAHRQDVTALRAKHAMLSKGDAA